MATCLNKHTVFLALLVTLLPQCFVTARPGISNDPMRTDNNMVLRSHHKGKRAWDLPFGSDTQDDPILSIVEETSMDKTELGDEPSTDAMWLDISKDFREAAQISRNADGELECEAVGSPPPKVFWLRDGMPIESMTIITNPETLKNRIEFGNNVIYDKFGRSGMANVKARLPLKCLQPEDEGHYTCMAVNRAKQVSATTYLSVIEEDPTSPRGSCEYRLASMSFKKNRKGSPAFIINSETFHMETMGKHVSLPCRVIGKPRPQITWANSDGKKIIHGKKFQVSGSGSLVIRNLAWKDMGVYTCTAENVIGKDKSTTFVYPLMDESESESDES